MQVYKFKNNILTFSVEIEAQVKSKTTVVLCDVTVDSDCTCEELNGGFSQSKYGKIWIALIEY